METDTSLGAVRLKVGGDAADANTHDDLLAWTCERRYFLLQGPGNAQAEPMASLLVSGGRRDPGSAHRVRWPGKVHSLRNAPPTGRSNLQIYEASHDGYGRKEQVHRHLAQLPRRPV